ncbi:hypothetical protein [Microbacterium sp. NPDC056234]|uniref:hypothetical protein n=1 Tax=Microbacterium sp. NPDC056234 TaxID=3345757 RepID=UPI0035DDF80A
MSPSPTPSIVPASGLTIIWDTFIPDLIVGLFTGLVVGVILAYLQSRTARRRERREIELRWEALRPRVGAQLLDPWDRRVMGPTLVEFASRTDALRELVQDVPLGSWAEILDSDELRNLHELVKAATELHGAAPKFDGFLLGAISDHLVEDQITASVTDWRRADQDAALIQPFAIGALFADPSFPWASGQFRDIQYDSPIVQKVIDNPPFTYKEVLAMVERAEQYYAACTEIVDAEMTRFWYH